MTKISLVTAIIIMALVMLSFPVRDIAADYHYRRVASLLKDGTSEDYVVMPISEKSMPAYLAAIGALQKAAAIIPSRSLYHNALADLNTRLGKWSEVMLSLKAPVPADAVSPAGASNQAMFHLQQAIADEPAHPDFHLALGRLYDHLDEPGLAYDELKKAEHTYPVNAPLRYALAAHYLVTGRKGDALEQARALAKIDDSYIISDSVSAVTRGLILERQSPEYLSMLKSSYLYGAFEIAWRVSQDPEVVKGIAPDTPDAAPVLQLFLDSKDVGNEERKNP